LGVEAIKVPQVLAQVLNRAGDKSGVDFDYLVQTAMRESSFNPSAKAQTSSAVGLFQFIESTWLEVMKLEGERLGYGNYSQAIEQDSNGNYIIKNNQLRNEVLALREDPQISADLAAAFTRRNGEYLSEKFGRSPSPGELYIAHFLGARGAEQMFSAGLENPDQIAANIFPRQAEANPSIFYDSSGPKTIREVYQALVAKHGQAAAALAPQIAANSGQQVVDLPLNTAPNVLQSRIGPLLQQPGSQMSFKSLYSNDAAAQIDAAPVGAAAPNSVVVDPGGAFFVQLYGR